MVIKESSWPLLWCIRVSTWIHWVQLIILSPENKWPKSIMLVIVLIEMITDQ